MIIGTRTLTARTARGKAPVQIRLYLPTGAGSMWDCRYEIDWPEETIGSHARGSDALQALMLAQQKIGVALYMSRYHEERKLSWSEDWEGYGFPLQKAARDLLIGQDAEFYGN